MRFFLSFFLLFIVNAATAQLSLSGVLSEAGTGKRLAGASVFLSNTSIGTASNDSGGFTLQIPPGKYDLVVSFVGYETVLKTIAASGSANIIIEMSPKAKVLPGVILDTYVKDGWKRWGPFFIRNFIGLNDMSGHCTIINSEVIKFRLNRKENILTAIASEPLLIENKALGFVIKYQLEAFRFDFGNEYVSYVGYPLFTDMKGGSVKQNRWQKKREEAYVGSMMHFMRALYVNKLVEEGFVVRRLVKTPNLEKKRVQLIYRKAPALDSIKYYDRIMAEPDEHSVYSQHTLIGDSITFRVDSVTAGMHFNNYLHIYYPKKKTSPLYWKYFPKNDKAMSQIRLLNNEPIGIQANGNYYSPLNVLTLGYWWWSEKISTMLPFDYTPPKEK